jgi:hypothetical protein
MSAYQCWLDQRERLREGLRAVSDAEGAASLTRRTLAQVEQNALSEQTDELLRQQTGILFSCFRSSLSLMDVSVSTRVWVAQSEAESIKKLPFSWWLPGACALQLFACLLAYIKGSFLLWVPLLASLVLTLFGFWASRRPSGPNAHKEDRLKITASPDAEKLFQAIEAQMKAIDRYVNDFAYLNEQNALRGSMPDPRNVAALAELMRAIGECDGETGTDAEAAASQLLSVLGIRSIPYTPDAATLYNILPSISETRTLAPTLVSLKDGSLLYRGTAAVLLAATGDSEAATRS